MTGLLFTPTAKEPAWRYLPHWLFIAFALRAYIALAGNFILHPDEILQYLEPAHRLVFGYGIISWEYYYGSRSWLVPGFVASILWTLRSIRPRHPGCICLCCQTGFLLVSYVDTLGDLSLCPFDRR